MLIPPYPQPYIIKTVEAFVRLRYTVGIDGKVTGADPLYLVGPKEFADAATDKIKKATFTPATLNGEPVEQTLAMNVIFSLQPIMSLGARKEIGEIYAAAVTLIKKGRVEEGLLKLNNAQARPDLNFYERGMIATITSTVAVDRNDYLEARNLTEIPTSFYRSHLPSPTLSILLKTRILADLQNGDLDDALNMVDALEERQILSSTEALLKVVESTRTQFEASPQITMARKIPTGGITEFPLSRRHFSFHTVSGALNQFQMICAQKAVESKITDTAEWHVPKNWNDCGVIVEGAPGTVFQVTQFKDAPVPQP